MTRGEIWLVSFSPGLGDEIQKTRPAVVISNDNIGVLDLRVAVPITAWQPLFEALPWMVRLEPLEGNGLTKTSAADAFQVKSILTRRSVKRLGHLNPSEVGEIAESVWVVINLPPRRGS